jgi:endonuclease YncB( thermonuclease family)
MKRRIIIGLTVLFVLYAIITVSLKSVVTQVKDGDSIVVTYGTEVRLSHIDAPEWDQPWGDQARERIMELTQGVRVRLKCKGKDRYGRTLAEVILPDGRILNHVLVQEGLAWHYRRYSNDRFYQQLELEARAKKRGLWSTKYIAPWNWRQGVR